MKNKWRWIAAATIALALGGLLAWRYVLPTIPAKVGLVEASPRTEQPRAMAAASQAAASTARNRVDDAAPPDRVIEDPAFQQCNRDYQQAVRARVSELAAGTPRDRIAAGLWHRTLPDAASDRVRAGVASALADAPDDPLIAWLHAIECSSRNNCDEDAAIDRLLRVDPDNLAPWLHALSASVSKGDETRSEALLQRAVRATHIDLRWGEVALLMKTSLGPIRTTQACVDAADEMGEVLDLHRPGTPEDLATVSITSSVPLPALRGITKMCPFRDAIPVRRVAACGTIFARMAASDELLPHLIGVRAMTVLGATRSERAVWRERLRNTAWMTDQGATTMQVEHLPLAWEKGEVAVYIALLEEAGRWPAPAGWLPADPDTRALIRGTP